MNYQKKVSHVEDAGFQAPAADGSSVQDCS